MCGQSNNYVSRLLAFNADWDGLITLVRRFSKEVIVDLYKLWL